MTFKGLKFRIKKFILVALDILHIPNDWITFNYFRYTFNNKPGKLAIFTQTGNEGLLLKYWESYYASIVGYENLFVLNNGSSDDSCLFLNSKTSVINMPEGMLDIQNCALIQGYFQRFLLQKYKWILKIDVDEFMACEGGLLEKIEGLPIGIYSPERAIAVIHDKATEPDFDYSSPLYTQRVNFVDESSAMRKPSLASIPVTWGVGNHTAYEKTEVLIGLWMLHLRYLDFERLFQLNKRTSLLNVSTEYDKTTCAVSAWRGKDTKIIYKLTEDQLLKRLSEGRVIIPDWISCKI